MGSKAIKLKDNSGNAVYPCPYYPIGSIYMSVNNINPANFFGGSWERIKDKFLLSAGDTYSAGDIGGEAEHTLTINEMPSHDHPIPYSGSSAAGYNSVFRSNGKEASGFSTKTGGNQPHNNMPPYLAVYIWKRMA